MITNIIIAEDGSIIEHKIQEEQDITENIAMTDVNINTSDSSDIFDNAETEETVQIEETDSVQTKDIIENITEEQIQSDNDATAETRSSTPKNSVEDILKSFCSFDEANTAISNMICSPSTVGSISVSQTSDGIQGIYKFANNLDQFGKALKQGSKCSVCGKQMKQIPPNGYCSIKCMMQDIQKRVKNQRTKINDIDTYINQIRGCLDALNLILNMVAEFPQKLMDIAKLPDRYKNFLQIRINQLFLMVKIAINKVMIIKNNLIIAILNPVKNGIYSDKIMGWFEWAKVAITTLQQIYIVADTLYQTAIKALQNPIFSIPPESYVWMVTPRAVNYYPGMLYVPVPVNMSTNPLNGIMSPTDIEKINKIVQNAFPPILAPEYLMPPKQFVYRLALSPQSPIVYTVMQTLQQFCKNGPEYLPRYKDLKLTNVFFVWAILVGWAPRAKEFFGSFLLPFA